MRVPIFAPSVGWMGDANVDPPSSAHLVDADWAEWHGQYKADDSRHVDNVSVLEEYFVIER